MSLELERAGVLPEEMEEHRLEIENRICNLFWTVSGDYSLEIRPDVEAFLRSKSLALYDAIKQGAFAGHFNPRDLALYLLKKRARGAQEAPLMELAQLCVDAAVYPIASRERSGVSEIRRQAFEELLKDDQFSGEVGQLRRCLIGRFLGREDFFPERILQCADQVEALGIARDTDEIIRTVDALYNRILDPDFEAAHGNLQSVLRITTRELVEYQRNLAMSEKMMQAVLDDYLSNLKEELLRTRSMKPSAHRPLAPATLENVEEVPEPTPEEAQKVYAFMERQFGKSYLSLQEQERLNRRFCTGVHRRCSLYFTEGILSNPAVKNTQFLRTRMQSMKNEMYFDMKRLPIRRSVKVLAAMLKRVQIMRLDENAVRADHGRIEPARLWKVGRTEDNKLFDVCQKQDSSLFVVDILLDSSSSQNIRQPQIAAQGYIISQALSEAGIAHRVSSFCSYWDYTMLHRFRDYDDPASENRNILQFRAFGENRDGLAIRTVCGSLSQRREENKILIILSDGRPNNLGATRPGSRGPIPYVGEEAVKDTAFEVRKAHNQGISVLGIFVGSEEDLPAEKKIFGKEFTYTRNISSFAHIVGTYLRRLMER